MSLSLPLSTAPIDLTKQVYGLSCGLEVGQLVLDAGLEKGNDSVSSSSYAQLMALGADGELKSAIGPDPEHYAEYIALGTKGIPLIETWQTYYYIPCTDPPGSTELRLDTSYPNSAYPSPDFFDLKATCIQANGNTCEIVDDAPPLFGSTHALKIDNTVSPDLGGAYLELTNQLHSFGVETSQQYSVSFFVYPTDDTSTLGTLYWASEQDTEELNTIFVAKNPNTNLIQGRLGTDGRFGRIEEYPTEDPSNGLYYLVRNAWNHIALVNGRTMAAGMYVNGVLVSSKRGLSVPYPSTSRKAFWGGTPWMGPDHSGKIFLRELIFTRHEIYSSAFDPIRTHTPYVVVPENFIRSGRIEYSVSDLELQDRGTISTGEIEYEAITLTDPVGGISAGLVEFLADDVFFGIKGQILPSVLEYEYGPNFLFGFLRSELFTKEIEFLGSTLQSSVAEIPIGEPVALIDLGFIPESERPVGHLATLDIGEDLIVITPGKLIEVDLGFNEPGPLLEVEMGEDVVIPPSGGGKIVEIDVGFVDLSTEQGPIIVVDLGE